MTGAESKSAGQFEVGKPIVWDIPAPFVQPVTIQPEHIDGFGHTNNVVYLSMCESVAWAHSKVLGLELSDYVRIGVGCVARRHELDYLVPTFLGDELLLATWIAENDGKTSMWRAYQIIRIADGRTVMRGKTHWVCVDMKSGRPRRQPPEFLQAYRPTAAEVSA
jgi:acyl-CoA thioester hydrolase